MNLRLALRGRAQPAMKHAALLLLLLPLQGEPPIEVPHGLPLPRILDAHVSEGMADPSQPLEYEGPPGEDVVWTDEALRGFACRAAVELFWFEASVHDIKRAASILAQSGLLKEGSALLDNLRSISKGRGDMRPWREPTRPEGVQAYTYEKATVYMSTSFGKVVEK